MAGKIKRKLLATFLNTGTESTETWSMMGEGITGQTISYNPQSSDEVYIHQDSGTTDVESYKPTISTPQTAITGDSVFDYVDELRKNRAVMENARTQILIVYLYETGQSGAYPAEKNDCSIQIDDFGGDGGSSVVINYTINLIGDPVKGTFNPSTKTFTVTSQEP